MPRGDVTREKLLHSALSLFHQFGYNGTSVQDIVAEAGVPKGSFYNHFKSKEEIAIAASDFYSSILLSHLELENTVSPVKRLRNFFRYIVREMQRYEYTRGCLLGNFAAEITNATPTLKHRMSEHLDDATRRIVIVITQAQQAGEMDATLPSLEFSRFLLDSLYGAIFRSKADRTERPMKSFERFAFAPFIIKVR
jgi:TetR/AcrR family transcriptional regulator, transcriptional repressor for nem operon